MWTKICDRANASAKLNILSDSAHRLWVLVLVESRQNEHLWRRGAVPREVLATWSQNRWRGRKLEALAAELVAARAGSKAGSGLWEPTEDGWQIHDWGQYGPSEAPKEQLSPVELGKRAGRASAMARLLKYGTSAPRRTRSEPVHERSTEQVQRTHEPPDPVPDHKSPKPSLELVRTCSPEPDPEGSEGIGARVTAEQIDAAIEKLKAL